MAPETSEDSTVDNDLGPDLGGEDLGLYLGDLFSLRYVLSGVVLATITGAALIAVGLRLGGRILTSGKMFFTFPDGDVDPSFVAGSVMLLVAQGLLLGVGLVSLVLLFALARWLHYITAALLQIDENNEAEAIVTE